MKPLIEEIPPGVESRILVVINNATDFAEGLQELVNYCVEYQMKIKSVEVPETRFEWPSMEEGHMIELNNFHRNKLIVTFAPA